MDKTNQPRIVRRSSWELEAALESIPRVSGRFIEPFAGIWPLAPHVAKEGLAESFLLNSVNRSLAQWTSDSLWEPERLCASYADPSEGSVAAHVASLTGMRPAAAARDILFTSRMLRGRACVTCLDPAEVMAIAGKGDFVFAELPAWYPGEAFGEALLALEERGVPFAAMTGSRVPPTPGSAEVEAGPPGRGRAVWEWSRRRRLFVSGCSAKSLSGAMWDTGWKSCADWDLPVVGC